MSTITKERLQRLIRAIDSGSYDEEEIVGWVNSDEIMELARIALASLEADGDSEPVAFINGAWTLVYYRPPKELGLKVGDKLYAAPPAPVSVPDFGALTKCIVQRLVDYGAADDDAIARAEEFVYNACRAAMLHGAEPVTTAYKLPEETGSSMQLRNLIRQRHAEWSQATFGDVGPVGPLKHLSKEALEAAAEPDDLSEWADMQFLLWDAQRRAGISDGEITAAMEEKLKVNMARHWPEPKDGEPRLHIKAAPQQEVK